MPSHFSSSSFFLFSFPFYVISFSLVCYHLSFPLAFIPLFNSSFLIPSLLHYPLTLFLSFCFLFPSFIPLFLFFLCFIIPLLSSSRFAFLFPSFISLLLSSLCYIILLLYSSHFALFFLSVLGLLFFPLYFLPKLNE